MLQGRLPRVKTAAQLAAQDRPGAMERNAHSFTAPASAAAAPLRSSSEAQTQRSGAAASRLQEAVYHTQYADQTAKGQPRDGLPAASRPTEMPDSPQLVQNLTSSAGEGLRIAPLELGPSSNGGGVGGGGGDNNEGSPTAHGGFNVFNPFVNTPDFPGSPLQRGINPDASQASPLANSNFSPFGLPSVELRFTPTPPPREGPS